MRVKSSLHAKKITPSPFVREIIQTVSGDYLEKVVRTVSVPRHYVAEKADNEQIGEWLRQQMTAFGYHATYQGAYRNIVAVPQGPLKSPVLLAGVHYDTVPGSPGADDNGSGIAVILACAKCLSETLTPASTVFVLFNREEERLKGSTEFILDYLPQMGITLAESHIMEMVGYCSREPGSQRLPAGLPIRIPDTGDFLGLIGNRHTAKQLEDTLRTAATYLDGFPVIGLDIYLGLEQYFHDLLRSDHVPFWQAKLPSMMWTDTAEFRNPHYHRATDRPETLDYSFMKAVAQLLLSRILQHELRTAG